MNNFWYSAIPLVVGTFLPVMASSNGELAKAFGSPYTVTLTSFLVAAALVTIVIGGTRTPLPTGLQLAGTNWVMWLGGVIVFLNIVTFTLVPSKIGVGNVIIFFVAGQIISSAVIENFGWMHNQIHPISWARIAGVILLISGVVLVKKF